jgi:hypothetical protein
MTHINNINESGQSFGTAQIKTRKSQNTQAFENALSKALDAKEAPEMEPSTAAAGGLKEITSMGPAIISRSDSVSGKTDKLLDMLDAYSLKLEDPAVSLKTIAPVLEQIKADAGTLEQEAETLTDEDSSLKRIAQKTIVTAQTEYLKFQRGDYLS